MRYLSICSGIEAATVAWQPLGWTPAAFSEIDTFPNAVLKYHYPTVPNAGDFTTIKGDEFGKIDLVIGGTPCQSFSVAGLRGGMDDERGNLAMEFIRLLRRTRPKWFIWENVPGVLSSNSGRDFASLLSGFTGQDIMSQKHDRAGIICGAGGDTDYSVAYRILDAQYFGVPQRRRRVFVVGYLGDDWRPPASVLFDRHSMCGNNKAFRKEEKNTTIYFESSFGKFNQDTVAGTLHAGGGHFGNGSKNIIQIYDEPCFGTFKESAVSSTLKCSSGYFGNGTNTAIVFAHHASDSRITGPVRIAPTVTRRWGDGGNNCGVLVTDSFGIQGNIIGRKIHNGGNGKGYSLEQSGTLTTADRHGVATTERVRKLTEVECERLQGFPDNYTRIPYRGKGADKCPSGHRYKALGNSMAVPVIQWIGKRISFVDSITK